MNTSKLKLTFLLLISLVPILLASWYFSVSSSSVGGTTTNHGVLINPVLDLAQLNLRDETGAPAYQTFEEMTAGVSPDVYVPRAWQLLFMSTARCEQICMERLYLLRQIHIRLSKEAGRVQRALVIADSNGASLPQDTIDTLLAQQVDLRILRGMPETLQKLLAPSAAGHDPISENYIYVADPLGNIMMYFTEDNSAEQILKDIDQLLDRSSLG